MNAKDLLLKLPETVTVDAGAARAVVQYDVSQPVYHVIENGTVNAYEGTAPQADVTIRLKDDDLVKLLDGELNAVAAVFTGRLKVRGDVGLAQRLIAMVDKDKLRAAKRQLERGE